MVCPVPKIDDYCYQQNHKKVYRNGQNRRNRARIIDTPYLRDVRHPYRLRSQKSKSIVDVN